MTTVVVKLAGVILLHRRARGAHFYTGSASRHHRTTTVTMTLPSYQVAGSALHPAAHWLARDRRFSSKPHPHSRPAVPSGTSVG